MTDPSPKNVDKHVSVRTAILLLFSLAIAVGAGLLLYAATQSVPLAVLTGGTAFAGGWAFLDRIIH
jgi:hypothetical protein